MNKLALVLAAAAFAGCEEKKEAEKPAAPAKAEEGSGSTQKSETAKAKPTRKVVDPSRKGQVATYKCGCTGKDWIQPAEEEKLCIDYCEGKMPECGVLVKIEPAAK